MVALRVLRAVASRVLGEPALYVLAVLALLLWMGMTSAPIDLD
jgi:hypothetical protein